MSVTLGLMYSCSNDVNFLLPQGPQGEKGDKGDSAYDVWKAAVLDGLEDPKNPGTNWPAEWTDLQHFFLYLTGKNGVDGKDGINGIDGVDGVDGSNGINGKSAYQIWQDNVLADEIEWPKDEIKLADFWRYLKGKDGKDGSSAYEIWKDEVDSGNIKGEGGVEWPKADTLLIHFWEYLSGKDGKDGRNGIDGLSAYQVWQKELKENGLADPFNEGAMWDPQKDTSADFWEYLSGKDGQDGQNGQDGKSAYELWKEAVAAGLKNPKDPHGGNWPEGDVSKDDFWEYLRGQDGQDGQDGKDGEDGAPGEPGSSGTTVIVQIGYFNVIAQYSNQDYSEYVSPTTGGVTYKVYDKEGAVAPGAIVKGLPGMDPDLTYTADANGNFTVGKEQLPADEPIGNRHGRTESVEYDGETEQSARNTYVPNKIQIRLLMTRPPVLNSGIYLNIPFVVERRVDPTAGWQRLPSYLGSLGQNVVAYEVPGTGPVPYVRGSSAEWRNLPTNIQSVSEINVVRNSLRRDYISEAEQNRAYGGIWNGDRHYISIAVDSYYGETPWLNAAVEIPPIQLMPLIKELTAYGLQTQTGMFIEGVEGEFDLDDVDETHLYNKALVLASNVDDGGYERWDATKQDKNTIENSKLFRVNFSTIIQGSGTSSTNNYGYEGNLSHPEFNILSPLYANSNCDIMSHSNDYFRSFSGGTFLFAESKDPGHSEPYEVRVVDSRKSYYPGITAIPVKVKASR